jgi:hypothetical protein
MARKKGQDKAVEDERQRMRKESSRADDEVNIWKL